MVSQKSATRRKEKSVLLLLLFSTSLLSIHFRYSPNSGLRVSNIVLAVTVVVIDDIIVI